MCSKSHMLEYRYRGLYAYNPWSFESCSLMGLKQSGQNWWCILLCLVYMNIPNKSLNFASGSMLVNNATISIAPYASLIYLREATWLMPHHSSKWKNVLSSFCSICWTILLSISVGVSFLCWIILFMTPTGLQPFQSGWSFIGSSRWRMMGGWFYRL